MRNDTFASSRGLRVLLALSLLLLSALPFTVAAQDMMEDSVFISIRHYDGVDPEDLAELERITIEGFVPIISGSDGFIAYYAVNSTDDSGITISVFKTREQALASNELAREFVDENLAPLLPNPPSIVEGKVHIGFVEMLDGMADGAVSSLHASVRLYDGFEADDLDEFVAIVEDGFLPIMRQTDGFFAYYLMNDGAGALASINIFDSEASALASNEAARDFVAENLTQYLPNDPAITAGRVGIAVLAEVNEGANLIDERIFVSIRVYEGLDPDDDGGLFLRTAEEFLDIIRDDDGFIGYYWLNSGDRVVAINLFATEAQASASNEAAREYVAENLADIVPGPPATIQGSVDIGFVEMLHGMADGAVSSLHASVRLYDGFEADDLGEFVAIVEDGFLPIMRQTDGFFAYYLMNDGAGALASINIFDSEASALASNDAAADFVAENLTQYLPDDPSIAAGPVGIAVLADVNDGANLINQSIFASVRVYDGVDPADQAEIVRLTAEGFLPIMRGSDGFIAYFLLPEGDALASVSAFETAEQAAASNDAARDFVAENLAPLLPNPPTIVQGPMDTGYFALLDEMMTVGDVASLYASLRIYAEVDLTQRPQTTALVHSIFLPIQQEAEGFWGYVRLHDGESHSVALSIYDSEANALAANEKAAAFVAEYLTDRPDEAPIRVNGRLGVAALADVEMGANLIGDMKADSVFASVRVYDGIDPMDMDAIVQLTAEGFLPIIRESDGFVGYYFLTAGNMLTTISLFDSAEQASASNEAAREFIAENLAPLLPNPPTIFEGLLSINFVAGLSDSHDHADVGELYASIRFYEGFDLRHFDEANDLAISQLLPTLQELGGLFAQFAFNDGEDTVVGISIFDSEEASLAANEAGKAFTMEYLADWAPNPPTGSAGKLAIAALAEINMGENLVRAMME